MIREYVYIYCTKKEQLLRECVGVYVSSYMYMNGNVSFCVACVRYLCCHGGWACLCFSECEHCVVYLAGVGLCCMFA